MWNSKDWLCTQLVTKSSIGWQNVNECGNNVVTLRRCKQSPLSSVTSSSEGDGAAPPFFFVLANTHSRRQEDLLPVGRC